MSCHFRNLGRNPLTAAPPTSLTYILYKFIVRTRVELAEKLLKRLLRYFGKYRFYSKCDRKLRHVGEKNFFPVVTKFLTEKFKFAIPHKWK